MNHKRLIPFLLLLTITLAFLATSALTIDFVQTQPDLTERSFLFYGDSITYGALPKQQADPTFPQAFGDITQARLVTNRGISSTTLADWEGPTEDLRSNAFVNRIKREDISKYDTIFLMYGTNDHHLNVPMGQEDDTDTTTFYGALNFSIQYLKEQGPDKEIILLMPPYWKNYYQKNDIGFTLEDYALAIQNRCKAYQIPAIDMKAMLDIDETNFETAYWDGLHPTQATYEQMGQVLAKAYIDYASSTCFPDHSYTLGDIPPPIRSVTCPKTPPTGLWLLLEAFSRHQFGRLGYRCTIESMRFLPYNSFISNQ